MPPGRSGGGSRGSFSGGRSSGGSRSSGMSRSSGGISRPSGGMSRPSGGISRPGGFGGMSRPSSSRPSAPSRPMVSSRPSAPNRPTGGLSRGPNRPAPIRSIGGPKPIRYGSVYRRRPIIFMSPYRHRYYYHMPHYRGYYYGSNFGGLLLSIGIIMMFAGIIVSSDWMEPITSSPLFWSGIVVMLLGIILAVSFSTRMKRLQQNAGDIDFDQPPQSAATTSTNSTNRPLKCPGCGAGATGDVCSFCGTRLS